MSAPTLPESGSDVHECEYCGDVTECDSIETSPATRYEPADGIYACRGGCAR